MPEDNNLTGINSTKIKIKAVMQSDGSGTPYIYSLSVNYTELISNYTGNTTNSTENQTNTTNSSQSNTTESNSTNSSQSNSTESGSGGSTSSSGQTATQTSGISNRERAARAAAALASSAPASNPAPSAPTQTASQPITGRVTAPTGQAIKIEDKTTKENSIVAKVIVGSIVLLILITIILTVYEYHKRKALKGLNKK